MPELPTHKHRFDLIGVGLSGVGMFLIVFSLQEGQSHNWAPWIWAVLVAGIGLMTAFVYWQSISTHEPLIPLDIFRYRDFSLCNAAAVVIAFAATGMILPLMFYAQSVCGLSPTRSALADRADGDHQRRARADRRQARRPGRTRGRWSDSGSRVWRSASPGCRS